MRNKGARRVIIKIVLYFRLLIISSDYGNSLVESLKQPPHLPPRLIHPTLPPPLIPPPLSPSLSPHLRPPPPLHQHPPPSYSLCPFSSLLPHSSFNLQLYLPPHLINLLPQRPPPPIPPPPRKRVREAAGTAV